ncbi:MAG: hypothetical protein RL220_965 [Bacteroidota bacterium]
MPAQNNEHTVYYDELMKPTIKRHAHFILSLSPIAEDKFEGTLTTRENVVKAIGQYKKLDKSFIEDGQFVFFYPNGQIESKGEFDHGIKTGNWERYAENGTRKPDRFYNPESATLIRQAQGTK